MKRLLLIGFISFIALLASAQTQQGFVKTKGRMVNGQLVPGKGLKSATVCPNTDWIPSEKKATNWWIWMSAPGCMPVPPTRCSSSWRRLSNSCKTN